MKYGKIFPEVISSLCSWCFTFVPLVVYIFLPRRDTKRKDIYMGLIQIEGMEFYAFHGHFKEEQIVGNKFLVDLTIEADMQKPEQTDNLKDAVNYQKAYEIVKAEMGKKSYLLENIAGRILDALYRELPGINKATVKVSKMNPPVGGKIHSVSVVQTR
jgi:7,8-dihydroneopterin aldolase/epimerase/oxygenase